ncbi:MAG TPA: hypothetical protein DD379_02175, partial [Cyanobacteria bacterium UBA11162]|nr:hypothetical protein [Cyanobacteria bacterium UBA11162]
MGYPELVVELRPPFDEKVYYIFSFQGSVLWLWVQAFWLFPLRSIYILQICYKSVKGLGKIFLRLAGVLMERGFDMMSGK